MELSLRPRLCQVWSLVLRPRKHNPNAKKEGFLGLLARGDIVLATAMRIPYRSGQQCSISLCLCPSSLVKLQPQRQELQERRPQRQTLDMEGIIMAMEGLIMVMEGRIMAMGGRIMAMEEGVVKTIKAGLVRPLRHL